MMSYAQVFVIALIAGCFAAHSERSRQRSGPIKSVPVAADIKRDVDFDCPEEFGYYPHPTDCTLYYVCVFGGALLESCTGGLMYSHELQTCDWPRNVGCDATSAIGNDDLERLNDRAPPPPPPPRRTPPPPPPRAQPNPVITSRGQPRIKIEREPVNQQYEKQQQLYAEVDDLPPVEEIESDRQQRVYRGQPSTIGQVQKDRDGYIGNAGRTLNSNIIPASLSQNNGKFGSYSFGSQVDDRRSSALTQPPQIYRTAIANVTDFLNDRQLDVNVLIDNNDLDSLTRTKRDLISNINVTLSKDNASNSADLASKRSDRNTDIDYFDEDSDLTDEMNGDDDIDNGERGKRQIRYHAKTHKNTPKLWRNPKPAQVIDFQQYNYNPNIQNTRFQSTANDFNQDSYFPSSLKSASDNLFSTANPFVYYQENSQSQKPFKASLPDPFDQKFVNNPINSATQIITKSPPISALKNNENPFASLAGGFYNNAPQQTRQQANKGQSDFRDSSQLPSTIVTRKPVQVSTIPNFDKYRNQKEQYHHSGPSQDNYSFIRNTKQNLKPVTDLPYTKQGQKGQIESYEEYGPEDENSSNTNEETDDDDFKYDVYPPPREYTHPSNKFANIDNPFASPNFDFDAFLDELRDDHYKAVGVTTRKPQIQNQSYKTINNAPQYTTPLYQETQSQKSNLNYDGMSTPRPFSVPTGPSYTSRPSGNGPKGNQGPDNYQTSQKISFSQENSGNSRNPFDNFRFTQENAGKQLETLRPRLKPPNFKDDREIPLTYNFNIPGTQKQNNGQTKQLGEAQQIFTVTQKPYLLYDSTGSPIIFTTPKQQYIIRPDNLLRVPAQTQQGRKPYSVSSPKPDSYLLVKQSSPRPSSTDNGEFAAIQEFWKNHPSSTYKPNAVSEQPKLENIFSQRFRPSTVSSLDLISFSNYQRDISTTTLQTTQKKRPIPKPSPEMNDYYYDDEDDPYYEPPVKSKYMPSSEVMPQRPPMAQNYQEYDDLDELSKPNRPLHNHHITFKHPQQTVTKNHNDVSDVTKAPSKDPVKSINAMVAVVPVMVDSVTITPGIMRPEISNYEIIHHTPKNRTVFIRKPSNSDSGPNTLRPPKYLNQTTLRPYTVRHRLAQTSTNTPTSLAEDTKQNRGRTRHQNLVAQIKATTMKDSQSKRTKTRLDVKSNSLEPTESVTPVSYSATPKPKMIYNGSESYSPDQFDPYYAVYDEDGVLYKDNDYVQQYNSASIRPAVQQTYRGTPPPARRPVETISTRPGSADDYDDALIQGQVNNQNQYRPSVRQPTRGEVNELGYELVPSSMRTTAYDVTSISTTPSTTTSTTTTTTTTPRPTSAPFTEVMTPTRYSSRSSNDENLSRGYDPKTALRTEPTLPSFSTLAPIINFSSQAKPFEKTDNSYRLRQTLTNSDSASTTKVFNNTSNDKRLNFSENTNAPTNKVTKPVSVTTGFSFRRNASNVDNPYTLTVLSRPLEYNKQVNSEKKQNPDNVAFEESAEFTESKYTEPSSLDRSLDVSMRRKDSSEEYDIPIYVDSKPKNFLRPQAEYETTTTGTTKYYLKTVIKRPAQITNGKETFSDSTENIIRTEALINSALENKNQWEAGLKHEYKEELPVSTPQNHNNLKSDYKKDDFYSYLSTSTSTVAPVTYSESRSFNRQKSNPSYYSYRVIDEDVPDQTTEVFSGQVKNIIQAFFNNLKSTPKSIKSTEKNIYQPTVPNVQNTVNIGYQKKTNKFSEDIRHKKPAKRIQIINEPTVSVISTSNTLQEYSTLANVINPTTKKQQIFLYETEKPINSEKTKNPPTYDDSSSFESKFSNLVPYSTDSPQKSTDQTLSQNRETEQSQKFLKIISEEKPTPNRGSVTYNFNNNSDKLTKQKLTSDEESSTEYYDDKFDIKDPVTTTTARTTTTIKIDTTTVTKNATFPTRASRVNPAIKLAAANLGGGRRSYQSTSKCSSDNSLQPNPKCNEIKYQRPTNTRGRGSAHYSTSSGTLSEPQHQSQTNRGTPPTRSRPTLKPSTSIVSKSNEFVDVYSYPPSRPQPIYPTPTPDKTAAKCRKDVCQLPDCYCGGKEIPGELPVDSVPQIVLLTFDDSVNDLNKGLYTDLFEKGRVNPNGCPISATFYVSHEWTDYSQVQNLYAAGHEMASHTISHSFGEQFSQKKWNREVGGQREILAAYGGVKLEDVRGMRAPFLSVGGNKMFKMLYDSNFTYDSSLPVYENKPPSWPYTLDYKLFHDCMIPPCPTKSYPGVWEVPMVMWQDLNGGRCSMGDACANPPDAEGVYKMILKNFDRHYTTNRAPFGLFYHAAWFTHPHHKEGFIMFLDFINQMSDVWILTNWQALQWVRDPTPISRLNNFQPFQCNYQDRPKKCNNPKVCNLWHKSGVRYMRTCQPCPEIYPWTGKTGIRSSRIDNDIEE